MFGDLAEIGAQIKTFIGEVTAQVNLLHQKIDWIATRVNDLHKAELARSEAANDIERIEENK